MVDTAVLAGGRGGQRDVVVWAVAGKGGGGWWSGVGGRGWWPERVTATDALDPDLDRAGRDGSQMGRGMVVQEEVGGVAQVRWALLRGAWDSSSRRGVGQSAPSGKPAGGGRWEGVVRGVGWGWGSSG